MILRIGGTSGGKGSSKMMQDPISVCKSPRAKKTKKNEEEGLSNRGDVWSSYLETLKVGGREEEGGKKNGLDKRAALKAAARARRQPSRKGDSLAVSAGRNSLASSAQVGGRTKTVQVWVSFGDGRQNDSQTYC